MQAIKQAQVFLVCYKTVTRCKPVNMQVCVTCRSKERERETNRLLGLLTKEGRRASLTSQCEQRKKSQKRPHRKPPHGSTSDWFFVRVSVKKGFLHTQRSSKDWTGVASPSRCTKPLQCEWARAAEIHVTAVTGRILCFSHSAPALARFPHITYIACSIYYLYA